MSSQSMSTTKEQLIAILEYLGLSKNFDLEVYMDSLSDSVVVSLCHKIKTPRELNILEDFAKLLASNIEKSNYVNDLIKPWLRKDEINVNMIRDLEKKLTDTQKELSLYKNYYDLSYEMRHGKKT